MAYKIQPTHEIYRYKQHNVIICEKYKAEIYFQGSFIAERRANRKRDLLKKVRSFVSQPTKQKEFNFQFTVNV